MGATSWTELSNKALARLGANLISALDDGSQSANYASLFIRDAHAELLSRAPWAFAMSRAALARDAEAPAFGYLYRYQLPSDFSRIVSVEVGEVAGSGYDIPDDSDILATEPWRIEGGGLLTDATSVNLVYIADSGDPSFLPQPYQGALVSLLASKLGIALARSEGLHQVLFQEALIALERALAWNAELVADAPACAPFIGAR